MNLLEYHGDKLAEHIYFATDLPALQCKMDSHY